MAKKNKTKGGKKTTDCQNELPIKKIYYFLYLFSFYVMGSFIYLNTTALYRKNG